MDLFRFQRSTVVNAKRLIKWGHVMWKCVRNAEKNIPVCRAAGDNEGRMVNNLIVGNNKLKKKIL